MQPLLPADFYHATKEDWQAGAHKDVAGVFTRSFGYQTWGPEAVLTAQREEPDARPCLSLLSTLQAEEIRKLSENYMTTFLRKKTQS